MIVRIIEASEKDRIIYTRTKEVGLTEKMLVSFLDDKKITSDNMLDVLMDMYYMDDFEERQNHINTNIKILEKWVNKISAEIKVEVYDNEVRIDGYEPNFLILFNLRRLNNQIKFSTKTILSRSIKIYIDSMEDAIDSEEPKKEPLKNDFNNSFFDLLNDISDEEENEELDKFDFIDEIKDYDIGVKEDDTKNETLDIDVNLVKNIEIQIDDLRDDLLLKIEESVGKNISKIKDENQDLLIMINKLDFKLNKILDILNNKN